MVVWFFGKTRPPNILLGKSSLTLQQLTPPVDSVTAGAIYCGAANLHSGGGIDCSSCSAAFPFRRHIV